MAEPNDFSSGVTEKEKELAADGAQEFESRSYISCVNVLDDIITSRSNDPKVLHNRAVAEFYRSEFNKTDEFKQDLSLVCKKAGVSLKNIDTLEDVDHCIIFYNYATILHNLRQYRAAITVLEKVFHFLEPLDEKLKRKVCFLLIELYLCTHQPGKALNMIAFTEKMLFDSKMEKESREERPLSSATANEIHKPRIQQYKVRCYLQLKSVKACKKELKTLTNMTQASNGPEMYLFGGPTDSTVYLKAQFEYMKHNHRNAMKILSGAPGTSPSFLDGGQCVPAMYYSNLGCIHFHMHKHNLGLFYFQKSLEEMDASIRTIPQRETGQSLSGRPLQTLTGSRRYELLHNIGLQLLFCGKPLQAFDCLIEVVQMHHNNPRLWLRLAECCIHTHRPNNEHLFKTKLHAQDLVRGIAGQGSHRKLILKPMDINKRTQRSEGPSSAIPNATMEFAVLCLKNALMLLPPVKNMAERKRRSSEEEQEERTADQSSSDTHLPAPPGSPLNACELENLRCSVLSASAYVCLYLGDNLVALQHAEKLLEQTKLSGVQRYLGHLYAAEALVMLDCISHAIDHLSYEVSDLSMRIAEDSGKQERDDNGNGTMNTLVQAEWFPSTVPVASLVVQYNLCVAYTIRGEFEKAQGMLWKIAPLFKSTTGLTDIPAHLMVLALYLQLQLGHTDMAKAIIKQNFPGLRA
ncbi:PREDICTED: CCR4-NOT transcription complex subunit 10-like isoform X2 [Priapulus caudatus]|nr:PREDICTED: CCR4-NOT transcription complex subunit 10-like isoform X2 [Priapulus caudatus]XP_014663768.1 PREDICTED: CCR4-NOT transcription complex subunit 10-like isoform X2 [Priapulus caudatus]